MNFPEQNFTHAVLNDCEDPDCEIHCPWVIEDPVERWTAMAWFLAGAHNTDLANVINACTEAARED